MAIGFPSGTASLTLTNLNNGFATTGTPSYVNVVGMDISPTGDRVFLVSRDTDSIYRYDLSTPFDFTTASHVQTLSLTGANINPYGIKFNSTGDRLFVLNSNGPLLQWISTSPYTLSTGGIWQSYNYGTANMNNTRGIAFNTDGTKMTVLTYGGTTGIHEFDLTTGFDPSTATYNSVYFNTAPYMTVPMNHWFNSTGTKLYVANNSGPKIHTFYLATPFDISSSNITVGPISNSAPGSGEQHQHVFNANETELYVIKSGTAASGSIISMSFVETSGVQDGDEFTFNNRDYIYDGTKEAWEVNSPITVAQTGSPVSDLSELADSTSILDDPANTVLTYADLDEILAVTNPATGQLAFNLDTSDMYIFGGTNWQKVYDEDDVPPPPPPVVWYGDRGVVGSLSWDYWSISTQGTAAQSTGQLQVDGVRIQNGCASDGTYGYVAGGYMNDSPQVTATIEYINFANTSSNAQDFGDMTTAKRFCTSCGDDTRGIIAGGTAGSTYYNETEYITYASPGNASAFGTLNTTNALMGAAVNDSTYALFQGDTSTANVQIDYVTIQTTGNASDFGDGSEGRYTSDGAGDATYALIAGGGPTPTDSIDYFTFVTPGNATDFGNLSNPRNRLSAAEDGTYATFARGTGNVPDQFNDVDYVTVQTPGNASSSVTLVTSPSGNRHWSASGAAA